MGTKSNASLRKTDHTSFQLYILKTGRIESEVFIVVKKETIRCGAVCGFAGNHRNQSIGRKGGAAGIQSKNFITITT